MNRIDIALFTKRLSQPKRYTTKGVVYQLQDTDKITMVAQKLGCVEDYEERLGISVGTILYALFNGIETLSNGHVGDIKITQKGLCGRTSKGKYTFYRYENFGKTWWLFKVGKEK